jgi:hypothetical protein
MNRQQKRAYAVESRQEAKRHPDQLSIVPRHEWPDTNGQQPAQVWVNKKYLVQLYEVINVQFPGLLRLSICRTTQNGQGRWLDGLTWDDLHAIKAEVGFQDWYAVEVYPKQGDVVNVANMRHLWLLPYSLTIGWFSEADTP